VFIEALQIPKGGSDRRKLAGLVVFAADKTATANGTHGLSRWPCAVGKARPNYAGCL